MRPLVLLGAGDHAREIGAIVAACAAAGSADYELIGYLVEPEYGRAGTMVDGVPVLGDDSWLQGRAGAVDAICAVGSPALRLRFSAQCQHYGVRGATVVHPSAIVGPDVTLGAGVVIAAGCILTQRIRIGDHSHLNIGCTLSHGARVADHVTMSPGVRIAGNVDVGSGCFLGIGASVIDRRQLGQWSTIGAGCTVIRDVPPDATVVGVPGRIIATARPGWQHSATAGDTGETDAAC